MAIEYNFKYMPLVGKLSGESMVKQTETAINEIAKIVNDNTAQAEIINTLAEQANANSVEALEKATEALDTSSRVYIKETLAVNLNNYCESQLIYINNVASQNLPVSHKGFLEVKTNDDKTQATQVFADDVDRKFYVRTGAITATTVGDVTTYTASYGAWIDIPNITDLDDYLALAGGTMSGDIEFSASEWKIKGSDIDNDAKLSIVGATDNLNGSSLNLYGRNHTEGGAFELNANNGTYTKTLKGDASGNLKWDGDSIALAKDFLPLSGGTMSAALNMDNHALNLGASSNGDGRIYTISNTLRLTGGSNTSAGSYVDIGSASSGTKGIILVASDGNGTTKQLRALYDGTLTWDGLDLTPQKWATATFADKSVASGTRTNLGSFTLTKGTWLICIAVNFPSNANGYRDINISSSSAGSQLDRYRYYRCAPTNGSDTHITWTMFDSASSNVTRYVNVLQNSGSALTVSGGYIAFRLSNDA